VEKSILKKQYYVIQGTIYIIYICKAHFIVSKGIVFKIVLCGCNEPGIGDTNKKRGMIRDRRPWADSGSCLEAGTVKQKKGNKMNIENTKAQMRKGVLEYCILLVLDGKPLYASDIIAELKEARMIVVEGTLYPLLTRLKNDGLLTYRWEESSQGPPRKYYELTPDGRTFLGELEKSWYELVEAVGKIKNHKA